MQYRKFGKTDFMLSALGIGTNCFSIGSDIEGDIQKSAETICTALRYGVNYIDAAYNYSGGYAFRILQKAFKIADREGLKYHATVKATFKTDRTAEETYNRICFSLREMGIKKASFFVCWGIQSYEEYEKIMLPGSLYEGALRAKEEGLVDSICFSTHAPMPEIIRILKSGNFDGVTISYSALNYSLYSKVLSCAEKNNIGVITMNSLGGGIIPQNEEFFHFLKAERDYSVTEAALRFVYAHKEISCCLSGMKTEKEVLNNINALGKSDLQAEERLQQVNKGFQELPEFCSGCNYCSGCPEDIPVQKLMQAYNAAYFPYKEGTYNRMNKRLLQNISITRKLYKDFHFFPFDAKNPCIHCGLCETKCTQHLQIRKKIDWLYKMFNETGYSQISQEERLKELLLNKGYKKVAFVPGGGYTSYVYQLCKKVFPKLEFEIVMFDNNPKLWGKMNNGIKIYNPKDINKVNPDIIVVTNYIHADNIYKKLERDGYGGKTVRLHNREDVPWVF